MKRVLLASAIAASFLTVTVVSPSVHAQKRSKASKSADKKKVKTYDFSGDTIDGDLVKPDGVAVDTRNFASHTSLIRIRVDFIKEILKSAEDL